MKQAIGTISKKGDDFIVIIKRKHKHMFKHKQDVAVVPLPPLEFKKASEMLKEGD